MSRRQGICVIGGGRVAEACAAALANAGVELVHPHTDLRDCDILSAAFDGRATLATISDLDLGGVRVFVDLATQSIGEATATAAACEVHSIPYFAGGLTGGVAQIGSTDCTVILGTSRPVSAVPAWIEHLGQPALQATLEAAISAKLLHNLVLIVSNHALGAALEVADAIGVRDFPAILAAGTAGRPPLQSSTLRDRHHGFTSSYSSSLVAKDLRAIVDSLPQLERLSTIDLLGLAAAHESWADLPYTCFTNSQLLQGQDMIGHMLAVRAKRAERRYRDRLAGDMEGLARAFPQADAAFQPERRSSGHDYDVSARVRMLEVHACNAPDLREGIEMNSPIELCDEDKAMLRDAVALILSDQDHLARSVAGQ